MNIQSLTKKIYSLLLLIILMLSIITIFPSVAHAQVGVNKAHKALELGLEAESKGKISTAKALYEQAIIEVGRNKDVEVLFVAKTQLADIIEADDGDPEEVKLLREQANAAINALGRPSGPPSCKKDCTTSTGKSGENQLFLSVIKCVQCPPGR